MKYLLTILIIYLLLVAMPRRRRRRAEAQRQARAKAEARRRQQNGHTTIARVEEPKPKVLDASEAEYAEYEEISNG